MNAYTGKPYEFWIIGNVVFPNRESAETVQRRIEREIAVFQPIYHAREIIPDDSIRVSRKDWDKLGLLIQEIDNGTKFLEAFNLMQRVHNDSP